MSSSPKEDRPTAESTGPWPSVTANSFRRDYLVPADSAELQNIMEPPVEPTSPQISPLHTSQQHDVVRSTMETEKPSDIFDDKTDISSHSSSLVPADKPIADPPGRSSEHSSEMNSPQERGFEPIKSESRMPTRQSMASRKLTEDELFRVISRKHTSASGSGSVQSADEQVEMERLMSRIFGKNRQEHSEDEKSRHVGVVFKNLTVKGAGLGAALLPTVGDPFLALPRLIGGLFSGHGKGAGGNHRFEP